MITVDELIQWPTPIRCFQRGSCHLRSTENDDELHEFARRLTPRRRERALQLGAVFVPWREQARGHLAMRRVPQEEQ